MSAINNTGSAILLSAILWFGYHYGFSIQLLILALLPLLTWVYVASSDTERSRRLIEAQANYYGARARYYERKERE